MMHAYQKLSMLFFLHITSLSFVLCYLAHSDQSCPCFSAIIPLVSICFGCVNLGVGRHGG